MKRFSRIGIAALGLVTIILLATQLVTVSPARAATIERSLVTCRVVAIAGRTEVPAPFVRVQVVLASNLTTVLGTQVVPTNTFQGVNFYIASLNIHVPDGTLLVISAGEWDGTKYLRPATLTSRNCSGNNPPPTPVPTSTAFVPTPPPPTPTQVR